MINNLNDLNILYILDNSNNRIDNCQTLGLVLRLRVDFVLPLSQQQQEEEEQEPLTKIY